MRNSTPCHPSLRRKCCKCRELELHGPHPLTGPLHNTNKNSLWWSCERYISPHHLLLKTKQKHNAKPKTRISSFSVFSSVFFLSSNFAELSKQSQQQQQLASDFPTMPASQSLPVSQGLQDPLTEQPGLRRRLSSLSLKLQPISSPATSWALSRSKSVSAMGEYAGGSIRKWWLWGWTWILSRKPIFAQDLEMNEEETKVLGSDNRGSWRHVFYKVRSELKRLVGSDVGSLPQTYRYNFDDGRTKTKKMLGWD